jgi:transposase
MSIIRVELCVFKNLKIQSMKKYFVGIDVSKKTLDVSIYSKLNLPENYVQVANDLSGFKSLTKWFKAKKLRFSDIAVCMEHTGTYSLDISLYLESCGIDYSLVSGLAIKRSLGLQRGKNDKLDSFRIARYCYIFRDELEDNYYKVPSPNLLRLRELMAERRNYVKRQVQCKIFLTEHKNKSMTASISRFTQELHLVESFICDVEQEMLELICSDAVLLKNYDLLISIVGVSLINALNVILYTNNFTVSVNARSYACYIGVAPFSEQSGTSVHKPAKVSKMANRQLKSDLSQAAISAVRFDTELSLYFKRKIASGKESGVVYNAVKFKLVERMFAVAVRGTPYVRLNGYAK